MWTNSIPYCPEIMDAKAISRKTIHVTFLDTTIDLLSDHSQSNN